MTSKHPTIKELEREFELRKQNFLNNEGGQFLQHNQVVHADCVWDVEIVSSTPLPVSLDSSHEDIKEECEELITVSQEEKEKFELVINEIDSVLRNEIEEDNFNKENENELKERTENKSYKEIERKITQNGFSSVRSNLKFGDLFYQKGNSTEVLNENKNMTNKSHKKSVNEFDIVGKFGELFYDGSNEIESESGYNSTENKENEPEYAKEDISYNSEDEKVSINITLSKKDLKKNLSTLQKLANLDPSTNEPLYAVVNKERKQQPIELVDKKDSPVVENVKDTRKHVYFEARKSIIIDEYDGDKDKNGALLIYENEEEAAKAYEQEVTRLDEDMYETEIRFEEEVDAGIVKSFYEDLTDPTLQNIIEDKMVELTNDQNYEKLQELHHDEPIVAQNGHDGPMTSKDKPMTSKDEPMTSKDDPMTSKDEIDFQEVEIVFNEFEDGGKQSDYLAFLPKKALLSDAELANNPEVSHQESSHKRTQIVIDDRKNKQLSPHIPETEIIIRKKEKQVIPNNEVNVNEKKTIQLKDTEIIFPKSTRLEQPESKPYEIKTKDNNESNDKPYEIITKRGPIEDKDDDLLHSKKKDSKSSPRNSMPSSLFRYFNDENSGTSSYNNKKGKRSSIFGSTNSLSSVHSTAKPQKDEKKSKKTFSLRKKLNADELYAEPGNYDNFLSIEDNDPVDLEREVKELLEMNKNSTRAHKTMDPPEEKKLFDIPEQIHYEKHYKATPEKRNSTTLKSGPGFTSLSIRGGDYNRRSSALSESLLY